MKYLLPIYERLYSIVAYVLSQWFSKATWSKWLDRRIHTPPAISLKEPYILFHASSKGEYAAIEPLILRIKEALPSVKMVLSMFSISAFDELSEKKIGIIDYIVLSPLDTTYYIRKFFKQSQPKATIFSGLDLWPSMLDYLHSQHTPYWFVNIDPYPPTWSKKQQLALFKPYIQSAHALFFITTPRSKQHYTSLHRHTIISGDMRIEQLLKGKSQINTLLESGFNKTLFSEHPQHLLMGSFEPSDMAIYQYLRKQDPELFIVIVPHDLLNENSSLFIELIHPKTFIINKIGLLKELYYYAEYVYVGGGFGKGVHNVIEALRFNRTCIIGPKFERFSLLIQLVDKKFVHVIRSPKEMTPFLKLEPTVSRQEAVARILDQHIGAVERVYEYLENENKLSKIILSN